MSNPNLLINVFILNLIRNLPSTFYHNIMARLITQILKSKYSFNI